MLVHVLVEARVKASVQVRGRSRRGLAALGSLCLMAVASGCALPGSTCQNTDECEARRPGSVCLYSDDQPNGVCSKPCESIDDCAARQICDAPYCVARDDGFGDAGTDAGLSDAGTDGGPTDAGVDAGGDAGADGGVDGGTPACSNSLPCPGVDGGVNVCTDAGTCEVECVAGFATCGATGTCTSTTTLDNCGGCGNDVNDRASVCLLDGGAQCGASLACSADGGLDECVANAAASTYECAECRDNGDCGSGLCCGGRCESSIDANCGCVADVGVDAGTDCTILPANKVCVSGTCGCDSSGAEQCGGADAGAAGFLAGLCAPGADGGGGACVDQGTAQCGVIGGVVTAAVDAGVVVGATCALDFGGAACIQGDGATLGECGCAASGDCDEVVVDDAGIPHSPASRCASGGACECAGSGGAVCGGSTPDCATGNGCADYRNQQFNCGSFGVFCGNPAFGVDSSSQCINGGCQCNAVSDCEKDGGTDPVAVDDCISGQCVCTSFRIGLTVSACPMGASCLATGCEFPATSGTGHDTLAKLLQAMGQP
jgi:hypothetical protein